VQSVRAARGLPHLVLTTSSDPSSPAALVISPPGLATPSLPAAVHRPLSDEEEKSAFENDSDAGSVVIGEAKWQPPQNNRLTNDDDPEPKTLARALFLYGFVMPLFWVFGASILFLDLAYHQTPEELAEDPRTLEERKADLRVLRRAEVRWAWRSVYALIAIVVSVGIALVIWAGVSGRFTGMQSI